MNDYYLVRFNMTPCMESETDILAALLGEKNFESFVPDAEGLSAYVKKELYDAAAVRDAIASYPFEGKIEFSEELIPGQDWNSEWEKTISNQLCLRTGVLSTVRSITTIRRRNTTS